jgi:ribosome-binding protein aMBF1 (putative translation factor)
MRQSSNHEEFTELFLQSIGDDIKRTREGLGLTQTEFAEKLNYEVRHIQRIERGHVSFKILTKVMFEATKLYTMGKTSNARVRETAGDNMGVTLRDTVRKKLVSLLSGKS